MGSIYNIPLGALKEVPLHSYKHVLCSTYFISSFCSSVGESVTTSGNNFLINWSPHKSLLDKWKRPALLIFFISYKRLHETKGTLSNLGLGRVEQ